MASPSVKKPLKEKIVIYYDSLFQGEDVDRDNPTFWHEFFLLKVNVQSLENIIDDLSPKELLTKKPCINLLFSKCCKALQEDHQIKVINALQTLCALIHGIFRKKFNKSGFDVIDLLVGFEDAEVEMQALIDTLKGFLLGDFSVSLRNLILKLLLLIVTAVDNVSENTILEFLMMNSIFETMMKLIAYPTTREQHGYEVVLLLTLLVSYRKHEVSNPYIVSLSILDDELALNGLGLVLSDAMLASNRQYAVKKEVEVTSGGFIQSITSLVGNMFVGSDTQTISNGSNSDAILLAFYEASHLNRTFFTVLSHVTAQDKLDGKESRSHPSSPVVESIGPVLSDAAVAKHAVGEQSQPSNLLATLLTFSSVCFQDTKSEYGKDTARLCFIILNCLAEDPYANSFLHDANMTFAVPLYQMSMYHRTPKISKPHSRPLICSLLDLMVEFIATHMMKAFPLDLYLRSVGIVHRAICYQKRCRIRLHYSWKDLWTSLMNLLKFLLSNESHLVQKFNIFDLALKVINIFNLFITYGDTFLPSPTSYDELYYEVIRMRQIFDGLYSFALRYSSGDSEWKAASGKLATGLVNVRAIINHFTPKIESWSTSNHLNALSEEQVLSVIRSNYDTLTLKLMENLDGYEKYSEKPMESTFFTHLVREITIRIRSSISVTSLQQLSVLQEFSSIT